MTKVTVTSIESVEVKADYDVDFPFYSKYVYADDPDDYTCYEIVQVQEDMSFVSLTSERVNGEYNYQVDVGEYQLQGRAINRLLGREEHESNHEEFSKLISEMSDYLATIKDEEQK